MRIAYIAKSLAPIGGLERVLCDKMNYLASNGYEIVLITYEQGEHPFVYDIDKRIKHIDLDVRFFTLCKYGSYKRIMLQIKYRRLFKKRLQHLIDKELPDIIITTTYSMNVADLIAEVNTKAKKVIESHVAYYIMRKTSAYTDHPILRQVARYYDWKTGKTVRRFDMMVTLTSADATEWGKHTNKIIVIPNPITKYPLKTPTHNVTSHRIICAGRLNSQKGFDLLIEAYALIADKCPGWNIDIFGSGEDKEKLLKMIQQKSLENRIVINEPTDKIYDEYMASDFFVLSSRYEGYPLVLNEAMSCGIPCVAYRCKYGPEEAITDKEDGLLAIDGDINDLADKMLWMIHHEKERQLMGQKARANAQRYQKEAIMQRWIELMRSLLQTN